MNRDIRLPEFAVEILRRLEEAGFEAYAVGGCVRNPLMGLEASDYDITTSALPEETKAVFSDMRIIETGIKHGTVTLLSEKNPAENSAGKSKSDLKYTAAEITTYRTDGLYSDRRHPDGVTFTRSLEEDLARRDFTVNAIAYSERRGMVDLYGGLGDIESGVLRCVGNAGRRFEEDALRIMRALRFMAVYGLRPDKETELALHSKKELLKDISPERVNSELCKLLCGKAEFLSEVLTRYYDVFSVLIPEISDCRGFEQRTHYHCFDVWGHTVAAVCAAEPVLRLRLAMLLHDLGKPACYKFYNGEGHFKGHASVSASICERVLSELRFDGETFKRVLFLVQRHDMVMQNDHAVIKKQLGRFGEEAYFDLLKVHIADDLAKAEAARGRIEGYRQAEETAEKIIRERECFSLKSLALNGNDIMKLGYRGREVGLVLDFLLNSVIEEKCANNSEALILFLRQNKDIPTQENERS